MYEEPDANYWFKLKVGDIVHLNDEQAIVDSMEDGNTDGVEYEISTTEKITEANNLVTWLIVELQGKDDEDVLFLVIKIVDKDISLRVFFQADDFSPGNRSDIIEDEEFWLFEDPEDEDNYEFTDLKYRKDISVTVDEEETIYSRKPQGVLYGESQDSEESKTFMASVIEYVTDDENDNPELIITEVGESSNGGYINVMFGSEINFSEIDVFPQEVD